MNVRGTNVRMGQHNANPIPLALARWQPRLEGGHRSGESQKKKFTSLKSRQSLPLPPLVQASSNQGSLNLNSLLKAPLKTDTAFNFALHHHLDRADRCAQGRGEADGEFQPWQPKKKKISENNTLRLSFDQHEQSFPVWEIKVP